MQAVADRLAEAVETAYPDAQLLALIRNHGFKS